MTTSAQGTKYKVRHDSLMVYQSWEAMFDGISDTIIINPEIKLYSAYHIEFDGIKKNINSLLKDHTVAASLGDSLWYINSRWLKKYFKGECKHMRDYVPLYYSAKIAFIQWSAPSNNNPLVSLLGDVLEIDYEEPEAKLYLIDFENLQVDLINSEKLSKLLSYYPDLQRRYESMHDFQKTYMINNFFLQYVQRLNEDPNVPFLF